MFLDELAGWFVIVVGVSLGLTLASFVNVVIYRLPRELNLAHPGSRCPKCDTPIRPWDNLPVLGWLLLRGRARCCDARISPRYPLIEAIGGLLAWAIVEMRLLSDHSLTVGHAVLLFFCYLLLTLGMLAAAAIDLEHMILPDTITLGGTVLGILSSPFRPDVDVLMSVIGAAGGFVGIWLPFIWGYEKLRGFPGMGLGDAKILALAGAWFGPAGAAFCLFAGAVQGTIAAVILLMVRGKIDEPDAVRAEREELLQAIQDADGAEREELQRLLDEDPLGLSPEEAPGGPRIAFGPFLALAIIELALWFEPISVYAEQFLLGAS